MLPLLQRGTDSVEFLGDAVATLWAQTDALVDLVPGIRVHARARSPTQSLALIFAECCVTRG